MMLVSLLVPVYNYETYVAETLESLSRQTYREIEIVIVDDGSDDASPEIVADFASRSPFPTRVLRTQRGGVASAMKAGMAASSGELIGVVHADDVHLPTKVARQVEVFREAESVSLCHTAYRCIGPAGEELGYGSEETDLPGADGNCLRDILLHQVDVRSVSMMFRRECLEALGGFDPTLPTEDWQAILKLSANGEIRFLDEALVLRRVHPRNERINSIRRPNFASSQFAPEVLAAVCPDDLSLSRVQSIHLGTLIVNSMAVGNVAKACAGFSYGWSNLPDSRPLHIRNLMAGVVHLIWAYGARYLPASLRRLPRTIRQELRQ